MTHEARPERLDRVLKRERALSTVGAVIRTAEAGLSMDTST
jgi:hypothetical protein